MSERAAVEEMPFCEPMHSTVRGALWRIGLTVLIPVIWISTTLLFVAFWARDFTWFQDLSILIVSTLLLFGTIAAMWATFGFGMYRRWVDW